jgi:hypothetical protein
MQKLSNFISTSVDTETFNSLPPLHKEVVTDFFKVLEKEDGNMIDRVEAAVDVVSDHHNVNTSVLYNYIDKEVDTQLGEK